MIEDKPSRLGRLLRLLEADGFATVAHLSRRLLVSEPTMRRDLAELERRGLILRVRGGAVAKGAGESPFATRLPLHAMEKQAIAALAYRYVRSGQCIAMDIGTTMMYLAKAIADHPPDRSTQFVTNGLRTARILSRSGLNVVTTGGHLKPDEDSMVGPIAKRTIRSYRFDAFFVSLAAITPRGALDVNLDEIEVKQEFMLHSRSVYALADSSKIGAGGPGLFAVDLRSLTGLITDRGVTPAAMAFLRAAGVPVMIGGPASRSGRSPVQPDGRTPPATGA